MSLRWKIALALGALAATATIAVGIAGYRTTSDRLHGEVDRSLVARYDASPTEIVVAAAIAASANAMRSRRLISRTRRPGPPGPNTRRP